MTCRVIGCHEAATTDIVHPDHGRMAVCEHHAGGYQEVLA
jgi:hypothetical protein